MPDTLSKYASSLDQDIKDGFVEILDEDEPVDNTAGKHNREFKKLGLSLKGKTNENL
jgi:hypothetical protein